MMAVAIRPSPNAMDIHHHCPRRSYERLCTNLSAICSDKERIIKTPGHEVIFYPPSEDFFTLPVNYGPLEFVAQLYPVWTCVGLRVTLTEKKCLLHRHAEQANLHRQPQQKMTLVFEMLPLCFWSFWWQERSYTSWR